MSILSRLRRMVLPISSVLILLFAATGFSAQKEVVVIGTFHGDHSRFPLYSFDTLRIVIEHIAPDLLLIEEDPKTYAEKWYEKLPEDEYLQKRPVEIRKVVMPYALKHGVKVVPVDARIEFDEQTAVTDAKLAAEVKDANKRRSVEVLLQSYESLFFDDYLAKSIYDFQSDTFMAVIDQYQELARMNSLTRDGQVLSDRRQAKIDSNITKALEQEKFKKALVVYGVTHRPAIMRAIRKVKAVKLISIKEAMTPRVVGFFDRERGLFLGK